MGLRREDISLDWQSRNLLVGRYQPRNRSQDTVIVGHMILKASFGNLTKPGSSKDFIPYFGTDYGICSIIKPQNVFDPKLEKIHYKVKTFEEHIHIKRGAEVGRKNGLTILLDTETFDYSFHPRQASEGFKIAIHHHLDQPIMSIKELDISPGSLLQV